MDEEKNGGDYIISSDVRIKLAEGRIPEPEEIGGEYVLWWRLQEVTLLFFLVFLVMSIIWTWWLLIPGFTLLGFNLYSNFNRVRVLKEVRRRAGIDQEE